MMCPPCERATRKRGRHRAHPCDRGGEAGTIGYWCGCPCNAPSPQFVPPVMALDRPSDDGPFGTGLGRLDQQLVEHRRDMERLDWLYSLFDARDSARRWWAGERRAMWARYGWEEPA